MFRRFSLDVVRIYAAQLITGLLGVVFVPFAVARLGLEGYATWSVYGVLQGYIVLAELGLGKHVVRLLAASPDASERLRLLQDASATYLVIGIALAVAAWPLAVLTSHVLFPVPPGERLTVEVIALLAVSDYLLGVPTAVRMGVAMSDRRFDRLAPYNAVAGLFRVGASAAAVWLGFSPAWVVAATVGRRVPEWWLARTILPRLPAGWFRPLAGRHAVRTMLGQTVELSVAQLLQVGVMTVGTFVVGWRSGMEGVGAFRAVFDVTSKVWFFTNGISLVLYPVLSRAVSDPARRAEVARFLPPVLSLSFAVYAVLAAVGGGLAPVIVPVLRFEFANAIPIFALLLGGIAFAAHANVSYELLQSLGAYRMVAALNALTMAIYLGCALFLPLADATVAVAGGWWLAQLVAANVADALGQSGVGSAPPAARTRVAPMALAGGAAWMAFRPGAGALGLFGAAAIATLIGAVPAWRSVRRTALPR